MVQNTGKKSEALFDAAFKLLGKRVFVYTFVDAAKATGRNNRVTVIDAQPCDRLLVMQGSCEFAEIKSTIDERKFPFSLLRKTQSNFARQILAAGGEYVVYLHSLVYDQWYRIDYEVIERVKAEGKASIPWDQLEMYKWTLPTLT